MTLWRTTEGVNKAEDAENMDTHIGFVEALRGFFLRRRSAIPISWLDSHETLSDRSSVTSNSRQCAQRAQRAQHVQHVPYSSAMATGAPQLFLS